MDLSKKLKEKLHPNDDSGVSFLFSTDEKIKEYAAKMKKKGRKVILLTKQQYPADGHRFEANTVSELEESRIAFEETLLELDRYAESLGRPSIVEEGMFIPAFFAEYVSDDDLTTEDFTEANRQLSILIEEVQPDLIIPFGNLPLKVLTKKSGIENKRGKELHIKSETTGKLIPVVPTYNIDYVYMEPQYKNILKSDIVNAFNKFIVKSNKFDGTGYFECLEIKKALKSIREAYKYGYVAIDIETTGLDFHQDKITCIGFSHKDREAFAVPIHHPNSPFSEKEIDMIMEEVRLLLKDKDIRKVFANSKFDMKFFMSYGITEFNNVHDIQFMHSLVDENRNHSLNELCKIFFPTELETL